MHMMRSDVVGSLLRPADLLDARARLERGELRPAEFKAIEDQAVEAVVRMQEAAGLDVITDGELRRYAFYGNLVEALEGFEKFSGWSITFRDGEGQEAALQRPVVVERSNEVRETDDADRPRVLRPVPEVRAPGVHPCPPGGATRQGRLQAARALDVSVRSRSAAGHRSA
jgi:methionine synthase II (cobalamin-independent)